jgi:hypothetical protein
VWLHSRGPAQHTRLHQRFLRRTQVASLPPTRVVSFTNPRHSCQPCLSIASPSLPSSSRLLLILRPWLPFARPADFLFPFTPCYLNMQIPKRDDANATNVLPPRPLVAKSTGKFEGNDGRWSTFYVNVGSDGKSAGQNFKVLISTSSPLVLLPQQAEWCDQECAAERGVEQFDGKQPRGLVEDNHWTKFGTLDIPMPHWYTKDFLGSRNDTPGAVWGVQSVALDQSSPQANIIDQRWVAGYTTRDFYMGSLGLAIGATGPTGASKKTFLTELEASQPRLIASSSYGYTAGAIYRE